jgi:rod shape-determining protein MreD
MLALVLVFWTVHQPLRVSIGAAFRVRLVHGCAPGRLLGQHALAYTVLSFFAITIHRRLLWFSVPSQAAQVLPLFAGAHADRAGRQACSAGGAISRAGMCCWRR